MSVSIIFIRKYHQNLYVSTVTNANEKVKLVTLRLDIFQHVDSSATRQKKSFKIHDISNYSYNTLLSVTENTTSVTRTIFII